MSSLTRNDSEIFERLVLDSLCPFCSTADGVLYDILPYQCGRCVATLRVKGRYFLPWCVIPTSNLKAASSRRKQVAKLKFDHFLYSPVSIFETHKSVLAYIT